MPVRVDTRWHEYPTLCGIESELSMSIKSSFFRNPIAFDVNQVQFL